MTILVEDYESNYFEFIAIAPIYSDLFNLAMSLRREVFVEEQGVAYYEEFDEKDILATHIVAIIRGNVCGTMRLIWNENENLAQISRFAVRKSLRCSGIGKKLINSAFKVIEQNGYSRIFLKAQLDKISFYEKFGFNTYGDEFLDSGILHKKMKNY